MDRYALKENSQFLVADSRGDIVGASDGLFINDTRLLSRWGLQVGSAAPSLLSSGVSDDNVYFRAHLTNQPLPDLGGKMTPEGIIHLERVRFLWDGRVYERIAMTNFGDISVALPLSLTFNADFADIFEVRGHVRPARGRIRAPEVDAKSVTLGYDGLDGLRRSCTVMFSETPAQLSGDRADFSFELTLHDRRYLYMEIASDGDAVSPSRDRFRSAAACARRAMRRKRRRGAIVEGRSNPFQRWLGKCKADIALLTNDLATGPYPCAGIPWFSTPFGRDGIITAMQMLWLDPSLARGVLNYLAANQASDYSAFQDASPGKILHEVRSGEMARLDEVPFRKYYGAVDSTPLFVMLAGAYHQRTGDMKLIEALWPALIAAMEWIEGDGDANEDGFVDYERGGTTGLVNQGWKDSLDAVFHADRTPVKGPIALVEVQGYAYAAIKGMANLAKARGDIEAANRWSARASSLRAEVENRFWLADVQFYALALDGEGKPCRVRASNAGHLLFAGLPSPARAARVSQQLASAVFDDGWGIRTLARDQPRFNPLSYHNGSIWPHDTALCGAGIARYGNRKFAAGLLGKLFAASLHFDDRIPELYCGFPRRNGEGPVEYPVACLPQAWSSGAAFMLLQACLGLKIDGRRGIVALDHPELPADLDRLPIRGLPVGEQTVDLLIERVGDRVAVSPLGIAAEGVKLLVRV